MAVAKPNLATHCAAEPQGVEADTQNDLSVWLVEIPCKLLWDDKKATAQ